MKYDEMQNKILVLCSGTGSFEQPFIDAGWEAITVDIDPQHKPTYRVNVNNIDRDLLRQHGPFKWGHASPDCKLYSIANSSRWHLHWDECKPITREARNSNRLVENCIEILEEMCHYWTLENPRGLLQKQKFMDRHQMGFVTYCQYGDTRMKPTNIWGKLPESWAPKSCHYGARCHEASPRGSRQTGTNSLSYTDRIKIPYGLGDSLRSAGEISAGRSWSTLEDWL